MLLPGRDVAPVALVIASDHQGWSQQVSFKHAFLSRASEPLLSWFQGGGLLGEYPVWCVHPGEQSLQKVQLQSVWQSQLRLVSLW